MGGENGNDGVGDNSGTSSPKSKVKFLCSYGGKILPRPVDGKLKYVGGETRVVAVPSDITFSEFMKKLTSLIDGDMVLKYQLATEDLDTLVSVRTDEDLKHMFHEYDRHGSGGTSMLRAFLFPFRPVVLDNQLPMFEPHLMEQRYIEAINGIVRVSPGGRLSPVRVLSASSACSSPKSGSPDGHTIDVVHESLPFNGPRNITKPMHRVRSSPSISSLSNLQNHSSGHGGLNMQQYDHNYHPNQNRHQHHPHGYPPFRMPQEPQTGNGGGRLLPPTMSLGKAVIGGVDSINRYHLTSRHQRGNGCSSMYHDEGSTLYVHSRPHRGDSVPRSPGRNIWE